MSVSEWKEVRLGEIAEYGKDRIPASELNEDNYVSTENMLPDKSGKVLASSLPTTGNTVKYISGQTLVSNIRPYFKKIWYADGTGGCSNDVLVFKTKSFIEAKYFYYLLSQDTFFEYVMAGSKGTKMPRGDKQQIMQFSILLPPLPEQKAIADTLSALDDKIDLNNKINKTLEEMAQAIFKSWFVDFEPFQDGEFEDSELGRIPKGWRVGSIYEVCDVIYGAAFKSKLFNENKIGFPLVRIRDLKTFLPQFYTNEKHPKSELVQLGDILVGMDAEFRPCIWMGKVGVLNQRVCKFAPKHEYVSKYFIYFTIKPHMEFIENFKVGTTVSHIGKGDIDKIKVIIPAIDVLRKFSDVINPLLGIILNNSSESQSLVDVRDTLLPKLMSGEIRIV